jgi:nitrogen-specific signal transduction histidine kinase
LQGTKEEVIGIGINEFLDHNQYGRFNKVVNTARTKSKYRSLGWKIHKINGDVAEVSIVSHSVTHDSDNVERLIMVEDLTEKIRSQRKLKKSQERLQQVLDGIDYTIWWDSSADDGFFYVSQAAEDLYAKDIELLENDPMYWYKYILSEDKPKVDKVLDEFQKHPTYQKEIVYRIKDEIGNIKWVSNKVWKSMINGNSTFRGITIDITDQINYKKERESYIKQIENYAFSASHELRKPISNILGLTNLLFENIEDKEKATHYARLLENSSDELDKLTKRLINDLEYTQRKQVD